jgi:hypothetical protein
MIRKLTSFIFGTICIYFISVGVYAQTCTVDETEPGQSMFEKLMPRRCVPMDSGKDSGTSVIERREYFEDSGISKSTLYRMEILNRSPIYLDGPSAILAQSDLLKLSNRQKEQLSDLLAETKVKARKILTASQRAQLGKVSTETTSIEQICRQMREETAMNKDGSSKSASEFRCPLCPIIQYKITSPTTQPSKNQ